MPFLWAGLSLWVLVRLRQGPVPLEGRLSNSPELWLWVCYDWIVCWVGQRVASFLERPCGLIATRDIAFSALSTKTLCERFEKAGLVWGLRVGAVTNHRAEFALYLWLAEPTPLAFGPQPAELIGHGTEKHGPMVLAG